MTPIRLSDHFTYRKLFRFVISPVLMMIFTSVYTIVDGVFVSNFVGKAPFAAVNLVIPVTMGLSCFGFMMGTGGNAIVAMTLGEGKKELANRYFSLITYVTLAFGVLISVLGYAFMRPISVALGAEGELLEYCVVYGRILFIGETPFIMQILFQSFFSTAEKPGLSLRFSILAGLTNIVLDALFIAVFRWGVAGAALATTLSQTVGGLLPLVYFARRNDSLLRLGHTSFYGRMLVNACANGSSEMVTNLSSSVVNILYNFQLMQIAGENGVAAYGIIMYVNFIFMAAFLGYSIGSAPIVSYHYGAQNHSELQNMFRKSLRLMVASGLAMTLLAEFLTVPLVTIFASYDAELFAMTCRGFRLYSASFLMMGLNVWGSSFFTSLNNGAVSAAISFLRTFLFQVITVLLLPLILGLDGIWLAVVTAESAALVVTILFLVTQRTRYHYA